MTAIQAQSVNAHPFAKFAEEVLNFIRGADFSRFSRLRYEQQREATLKIVRCTAALTEVLGLKCGITAWQVMNGTPHHVVFLEEIKRILMDINPGELSPEQQRQASSVLRFLVSVMMSSHAIKTRPALKLIFKSGFEDMLRSIKDRIRKVFVRNG